MTDSQTDRDPHDSLDQAYETRISALIDGQLDPELLLATLDYLVNTPSARELYREARALDGLLQALGQAPARERPGADLWQRILAGSVEDSVEGSADTSPQPTASRFAPARLGAQSRRLLAAAAAVILVGVGLASLRVLESQRRPVPSARLSELPEVVLGERSGEMSDDRFVALATELLQADPRYRREMLELMTAIEREPLAELTTEENRRGESTRNDREDPWDPGENDPFRSRLRVELW